MRSIFIASLLFTAACFGGSEPGKLLPAQLQVSHQWLDMPAVVCGAGPSSVAEIEIRNAGGVPLEATLAVEPAEAFELVGATTRTVAPGARQDVGIRARAIDSGVPGALRRGRLIVTANGVQSIVELSGSIGGGALVLDPPVIDFGRVPAGGEAREVPVVLRNTGNAPLDVKVLADGPFFSTGAQPIRIAPGAASGAVRVGFRPADTGKWSGTLNVQVDGPVCTPRKVTAVLSAETIRGALGIEPGRLHFGAVPCGTKAADQVLELTNAGDAPFTFKVTHAGAYAISLPDGAKVAPKGRVRVIVSPPAIPSTADTASGAYDDVLSIETDIPRDEKIEIPLVMSAHGAVLRAVASSIDFGTTTGARTLVVQNAGSAPANVWITTDNGAFIPEPGGSPGVVAAARDRLDARVTFSPPGYTTYTGNATVHVAAGTPLCAPLPSGVSLRGSNPLP
jgi:hypothetical protein